MNQSLDCVINNHFLKKNKNYWHFIAMNTSGLYFTCRTVFDRDRRTIKRDIRHPWLVGIDGTANRQRRRHRPTNVDDDDCCCSDDCVDDARHFDGASCNTSRKNDAGHSLIPSTTIWMKWQQPERSPSRRRAGPT